MKLPFQLDRYTLVHRIGVGAFGQVYRAEVRGDMGFVSDFAVKVLEANVVADNPNVARALADEARILSQLDHPNIVKVVDFKHIEHPLLGDVYFMVMECVRGTDVGTLLRRLVARQRSVPATAVLHMGLMISDALAHAHALQNRDGETVCIVHRDLKPQNLMVNFRGQVKVLDFGIAKATDDDRLAQRTQEGQTKGTVFYMSPEQLAGDPLDGRSDIYSLGTILYELLMGTRLLDVEVNTAAELVRAMHTAFELDIESRLDALRSHLEANHNGALSQEAIGGWIGLLRAALQKDRNYRPDSAASFSQQLERLRSLHPPAENRNFWTHEVEAAAADRDVTFSDLERRDHPAESVPEDAGPSGSGTREFFGMSAGAVADDDPLPGNSSPEAVPLTRGMGVVTGTVRSFGSEIVQHLGPTSRSQPALHSAGMEAATASEEPTDRYPVDGEEPTQRYTGELESASTLSAAGLSEEPTQAYTGPMESAADLLSQDGSPNNESPTGQDDEYEITVTDAQVVVSGSYQQQRPTGNRRAPRSKPALIGASSGLISALLILGLVAGITWFSSRDAGQLQPTLDQAPPAAISGHSAATEGRTGRAAPEPDGLTNPGQQLPSDSAAAEDDDASSAVLIIEDATSEGAGTVRPAAKARSTAPNRSTRKARSESSRQQASKRTSKTTSSGRSNTTKKQPRRNAPAPQSVVAPVGPAAEESDPSEMGFVRLVARPRCRVIRHTCPCPWAKARTSPPDAGVALGTTDDTRKGVWLPAGKHRIRFICDDEEECKNFKNRTGGKTITVEAGEKKIYKVDFYAINERKR
ncbi:MAG: hypothetical protein CMP23_02975 [Rickettsiales bacterium]|nr:hypothetical protein [Rickettsiales bacterium]